MSAFGRLLSIVLDEKLVPADLAAVAPKRSLFKSSSSRKNHHKGDTQRFLHSGNYDMNNRRHVGYILLGNM